jgi:hypothetical protein
MRHALIDQKERNRLVSLAQMGERFEGRLSGLLPQDAIPIRVSLAKVAFYGPQNLGVVVDRQERWFSHSASEYQGADRPHHGGEAMDSRGWPRRG